MEALSYLVFSAVLYITCKFFRLIFRDYIFNEEMYLPDDTGNVPAPQCHRQGLSPFEPSARFFAYLRKHAC